MKPRMPLCRPRPQDISGQDAAIDRDVGRQVNDATDKGDPLR